MPFSLVKAIKSTHMNPINKMLHCIGAPFYIFGIVMIVGHFLGTSDFNLLTGIILWSIAVGLFLTGHKIERNLRAMTLIILFRYFSSTIAIYREAHTCHSTARLGDSHERSLISILKGLVFLKSPFSIKFLTQVISMCEVKITFLLGITPLLSPSYNNDNLLFNT